MTVDHWMLFSTFAEQRHFEYPEVGTYQGVILNANMAVHAPNGLAVFLLEKTAGMKYLVDPLTHAFQHDPETVSDSEGQPKKSIRSLAEEYGPPVQELLSRRRPLLPRHLEDSTVRKGFVERIVRFQRTHLKTYMEQADARKYLDDEAISEPYAVIAPYFFLAESTLGDWLDMSVACIEDTRELTRDAAGKVFAAIVINRGVLADDELRRRVSGRFIGTGADGFLLWVDDLDEQAASKAELNSLLDLCRELRGKNNEREVINRHGGYFSILAAGSLGKGALSGVAHGPEFGEFRSVVPVGGGIPIARYYIPQLHARVRYRDALRMLKEQGWLEDAGEFHRNVCDCEACRSVLNGDIANFALYGEGTVRNVRRRHGIVRINYPTGETKLRCLRHYLQRKMREYRGTVEAPAPALLDGLLSGAREFEEVAGLDGVSHLRKWHDVLSSGGDE